MQAVLRLAAHNLRARWRGWAVLALLVGLAGGAVLAAVAGALRTDSAYPRFLERSKAADVLVSPANSGLGGYYSALARLPDVAAIAPVVGLDALPLGPGGTPISQNVVVAPLDDRFGHLLEVPKMLAGRQPRPDQPGEVMVDHITATDLHLRIGSRLEIGALAAGADFRHVRLLSERVVGIMVTRGSVVPVTVLDRAPVIVASTALFRELGPRYLGFDGAYVKLRPGATPSGFGQQAQMLARSFPATGGQVFVADEATQAATVERSIRPQAVALALFALVLALCTLLIVGQVASRLLLAASSDNDALAALGMTRLQLLAAGLIEVGVAAAVGAAVACGVAVAASPLMPIGPARLAEPDPGVSVNGIVLAVGFAAIVVLLLARIAWPAWRQASARPSAEHESAWGRRSLAGEWLAGFGAPLTTVTGVRLAFDPGRGRTAVPVRAALLGTAVAVAAVAAAFTFGANLLHLVNTPRLYGQDWDIAVDIGFGTITPQQFDGLAARAPGISGWTFGVHGTVGIGTTVVPAIGLAPGRGPLMSPTLLAGRAPQSKQEIVLGSSVLRALGLQVGQSVPVTVSGHRLFARIAGRAVFPYFGEGSFTPTDVGNGAEATAALLEPQATAANGSGYNLVLVRFDPGTRLSADIAGFERVMSPFCSTVQQSTCVVTDQRPNAVANYALIDGTPEVLAGILAVLGLAVLGQFVVASARRRRRDFAIMKVLGLLRRQLTAVSAWQVTTLTGLALLVGLPLGVAGGRWAWDLFATNVGLPPGAITPVPLLWMIPVTLAVANVIALRPGQQVARLSPAAALRAELPGRSTRCAGRRRAGRGRRPSPARRR
jgi:putative ABC transport system permease protein